MIAKTIWINPEFLDWYKSKPLVVQEAIEKCPPDKPYIIKGGSFPCSIYSYDEAKDGGVTLTVNVYSPLFPRSVFGVRLENIEEYHEESKDVEQCEPPHVTDGLIAALKRMDFSKLEPHTGAMAEFLDSMFEPIKKKEEDETLPPPSP